MSEFSDNSEKIGRVRKLVLPDVLAELWSVPVSWIYEHTRDRCEDPIPFKPLGKYIRFDLEDPELWRWLERQRRPVRGSEDRKKKRGESKRKEER